MKMIGSVDFWMRAEGEIARRGARIVSDAGGPFARTFLLDRGSAQGIEPGHAILTTQGLVGRIISVGDETSRALA